MEPYDYQVANAGKKQVAYDAVRQVMAAARGLRADVPTDQERPGAVYFLPLVVTSSPLFTCRPGPGGEPEIEPAERVLLISGLVADYELRSVWVMRDAALPSFMPLLWSLPTNSPGAATPSSLRTVSRQRR